MFHGVYAGYNVFGFDYKFMYERAFILRIHDRFSKLGRVKNQAVKLEEKKLSSSALGDNTFYMMPMRGRVLIDLMKTVQGNPSFKLESYSLDNVSSTFMRGDIKEVTDVDGTCRISTKSTKGLQNESYVTIVENNGIIETPFADGRKFMINNVTSNSFDVRDGEDISLQPGMKYQWCENKDDISVKQIFACMSGTSADRAEVAKYCVQDCALVGRLYDKLDILTNAMAMANVCCVPLSYLFLRGQGVKVLSLVTRQTRKDGYLLPVIKKKIVDDDGESEEVREGFEGAIVLEPKCDVHYEPVAVSDFASLYPSSMIAMNLSHETYVNDPGYLDTPGVDFETIEYDNYEYVKMGSGEVLTKVLNTKEPVKRCVFAQPKKDESEKIIDASRGVVPRILQNLLSARKATKKKMANEPDPFRKSLLDSLQAAYKVTANSVYGQMGASTSPVALKELAASCTATGRRSLLFARDYMVEKYGATAVYGDSVAAYTPIVIRKSCGDVDVVSIDSLAEVCGSNWFGRSDDKQISCVDNVDVWSDEGWTAVQQIVCHALPAEKKLLRVMTNTGLVDVTDDHSLLTVGGQKIRPKDVRVGDRLLHHPLAEGIFGGPEHQSKVDVRMQDLYRKHRIGHTNTLRFDSNDQRQCAEFVFIAKYLYIPTVIDIEQSGKIKLSMVCNKPDNDPCEIKMLYELEKRTEYVYDLTTSNSHFAAGIGDLIVHNTDSVFMHFKCKDADGRPLRGLEAVRESMRVCMKASSEVSRLLPAPNNLEFEKVNLGIVEFFEGYIQNNNLSFLLLYR